MTINLPERCYCADVDYPMAVVGGANRNLSVYRLEGHPQEYKKIESTLKYQVKLCLFITKSKLDNRGNIMSLIVNFIIWPDYYYIIKIDFS